MYPIDSVIKKMSLSPFPQLTDEQFLDKLKRKHVSFSYCPTTQILEVLAEAKLRHQQNEVADLKASLAEETKKRKAAEEECARKDENYKFIFDNLTQMADQRNKLQKQVEQFEQETHKRGVLLRSSISCPVCLEDKLEEPIAMNCGHVLCETCHFGIKGICPLCRKKSEYYFKLFAS